MEKISIENVLKLDSNDAIITLDDFIVKKCNYGEDLGKLTEAEKVFYFNQEFEKEVNNGGIDQYFFNSAGNNSHETVKSLRLIEAEKTAIILQEAINLFPHKTIPHNREERQEILEEIREKADDKFNELDERFYKYEDDLNSLNLEFIKKHIVEFTAG